MEVVKGKKTGRKRKVAYRKRKQNRFSVFLVVTVVMLITVAVAMGSAELKARQADLDDTIKELQTKIEAEEDRAKEIEQYEKYTHTKSYVEEVAKDKLGLVYDGEILFKEDK